MQIKDLLDGDYPTVGMLCQDIASLGYGQEQAIDRLYPANPAKRSELEHQLAARVCESCTAWRGCEDFVQGALPVDEEQQFGLRDISVVDQIRKPKGSPNLIRPRDSRRKYIGK